MPTYATRRGPERKRLSAMCATCGALFERVVSQMKTARYCSQGCFYKGKSIFWMERFSAMMRKTDGCWEWTGCRTPAGYGKVTICKKSELAHRVSFKIHIGVIPDGIRVLHKCDNPPCCNPDHLFLGTAKDNTADMYKKGRSHTQRGKSYNPSKLTEDDVREIRANASYGVKQSELARRFSVHQSIISRTVNNHNWRHVLS